MNLDVPSAWVPHSSWSTGGTQEEKTAIENSHWSWVILICLIILTLLDSEDLYAHRRGDKSKDQGDQKTLHLGLWDTDFTVEPPSASFPPRMTPHHTTACLTKAPWRASISLLFA